MIDRPAPDDTQDADSNPKNPEDLTSVPPDSGDDAAERAFDALLAESSRQIGPYKLLQEIGVGGMGTVWLAQQERPVRRRVAVKLIKAGRADKQVIARFEAERQALSMMNHPNIAQVLDAGTAQGGTPYFVMELVQGDPITKYCDRHKLTPRERLELFTPVCQAIQHAHQKGIIHRDLKPSNVLVHVDDGKPIAKVIDFGLAKALQHQTKLTDKTIFTEFGQIVGTVQYMSPEQARTDAIDIDTRTDIYSLGVMLYELMAGSTPLDEDTINQNAVLELLKIIREKDPPRPSHRLSSSIEKLESISEQRRIQPAKLRQLLSSDLDWIIMKSLDKDRTRRYATPNDFADDIRRYLDGDAVVARAPTTGYRVRKFVRKHRTLVATVALFMALLAAGIAGTISFAWKANQARQEAVQSRQEAEKLAKRSAAVLQVVTNSFESVDPSSGSNATMTAKDVLLQALHSLEDSDLDDAGRISLLSKLTTCFISIGEYDSAISAAKETLRLSKDTLGDQHPGTLSAMSYLATAYEFAGQLDKSLPLYEQTLRLRQNQLGDAHPDSLVSLGNLATAYQSAGRFNEALPLHEQTLRLRKAQLGDQHPQTLSAMNNLAGTYQAAGRLDEALSLFEETLQLMKANLGNQHPETLTAMNNLAGAYESAGRLEEAIPLYKRTLRMTQAKLGDEHPDTLVSMNNLAYAYQSAGRLDEALPLFQETLQLIRAELGDEHPFTLSTTNNLASVYRALGQLQQAIPLFEQSVQRITATLGDEHPMTQTVVGNLASAYQEAGRLVEALPLHEQVLRLRKSTLGDQHPQSLSAMNTLASAYELDGRFDDAATVLEECLAARQSSESEDWVLFDTQSQYGGVLLQLGQIAESAPLLLDSYETLERTANSIPAVHRKQRLTRALDRLIRLAEVQQTPADAAKWRQKLDELNDDAGDRAPVGE